MRARLALVCLLAALAVAGCGPAQKDAGPPAAARDGAADDAAITILAPADGGRLRATSAPGGDLKVRARVRGRARPGSVVFLSAGCRPRPCRARASTGAKGTWRATMAVRVPRAAAFVTFDAAARRATMGAGAAVATVELVDAQASRSPVRPPRGTPASGTRSHRGAPLPSPPSRPTRPHEVLVIGDSLAEGMAAPLRAALPGWSVRVDALTSRPLATGMRILAAQAAPPAILALSLFTNDDPRSTRALEAAVRATATRPGGCAVWSTVVRPPNAGVSYAAANTLLRGLAGDPRLAAGLALVDWAGEVAQSPSLLAGDGVHATPAGYRARGLMYAAAIRACAGEG